MPEDATDNRPRPLSRFGLAWRLTVTAIALVVLTAGQLLDTNDFFPLGSLSQYATARDLDGVVRSLQLYADVEGGDGRVKLPFVPESVGITRSELEGQRGRVFDNPSMLQDIAEAYVALRPDARRPIRIYVVRRTIQLEDGIRVGEPVLDTLAEWEVEW